MSTVCRYSLQLSLLIVQVPQFHRLQCTNHSVFCNDTAGVKWEKGELICADITKNELINFHFEQKGDEKKVKNPIKDSSNKASHFALSEAADVNVSMATSRVSGMTIDSKDAISRGRKLGRESHLHMHITPLHCLLDFLHTSMKKRFQVSIKTKKKEKEKLKMKVFIPLQVWMCYV